MKTKTVGELLRDAREKYKLSTEEFAQVTRIRHEYIQALEANKFEELPSATFVKGYIKTYGKMFGFDHQPVIALLRRDYKESSVGKLVPREFIKPILKRRQLWTPVTFTLLALSVVFGILLSYVAVQWYNVQKPPKLIVTSPDENAFVSAQIEVEGQTVTDASVKVDSAPVAIRPDGSFHTQVYAPQEGTKIITIEVRDSRGKVSVVQRVVRVKY